LYKLFASNDDFLALDTSRIEKENNAAISKIGNREVAKETAVKQIEYLLFEGPAKFPRILLKEEKEDPKNKKITNEMKKKDYEEFIEKSYPKNMIIKQVLNKKVAETLLEYKEKCKNREIYLIIRCE
jgi:hypothetical protein